MSEGLKMVQSVPREAPPTGRALRQRAGLAGAMVDADVVKIITAHGMAVLQYFPDANHLK